MQSGTLLCWTSPRPPAGSRMPWKSQRTQHVVTLMAVIYYREKIQRKGSNGKVTRDQSQRQSSTSFQGPALNGVRQDTRNTPRNKLWRVWNVANRGSSLETRGPGFLLGGWSLGHPLPDMSPNSSLPKGKQVFSINRIIDSLGIVSHFCQLQSSGNTLEIQVTRCQGPNL